MAIALTLHTQNIFSNANAILDIEETYSNSLKPQQIDIIYNSLSKLNFVAGYDFRSVLDNLIKNLKTINGLVYYVNKIRKRIEVICIQENRYVYFHILLYNQSGNIIFDFLHLNGSTVLLNLITNMLYNTKYTINVRKFIKTDFADQFRFEQNGINNTSKYINDTIKILTNIDDDFIRTFFLDLKGKIINDKSAGFLLDMSFQRMIDLIFDDKMSIMSKAIIASAFNTILSYSFDIFSAHIAQNYNKLTKMYYIIKSQPRDYIDPIKNASLLQHLDILLDKVYSIPDAKYSIYDDMFRSLTTDCSIICPTCGNIFYPVSKECIGCDACYYKSITNDDF
jgi:hypothetical protein